ncbi:DUF4260 family protein [Acidobacteria bacterium AB60]|nr:DUF4260 family protein [Acidobacteria bacterium AB60]
MITTPALLLRFEALGVLVATILLYQTTHGSWLLFAVLFLAPDLFMLGYLANVRAGAALYNFAHTLLTPCTLLAVGFVVSDRVLQHISLIWIAHIEFDRVLGYGLKYPTFFKDTHLQHL